MTGLYPFDRDATVLDREGATLAEIAIGIWRARDSSPGDAGQNYDFDAVATIDAADALVGKRNRIVVVGAERYSVLDAIENEVLPHVELRLRQVKADG